MPRQRATQPLVRLRLARVQLQRQPQRKLGVRPALQVEQRVAQVEPAAQVGRVERRDSRNTSAASRMAQRRQRQSQVVARREVARLQLGGAAVRDDAGRELPGGHEGLPRPLAAWAEAGSSRWASTNVRRVLGLPELELEIAQVDARLHVPRRQLHRPLQVRQRLGNWLISAQRHARRAQERRPGRVRRQRGHRSARTAQERDRLVRAPVQRPVHPHPRVGRNELRRQRESPHERLARLRRPPCPRQRLAQPRRHQRIVRMAGRQRRQDLDRPRRIPRGQRLLRLRTPRRDVFHDRLILRHGGCGRQTNEQETGRRGHAHPSPLPSAARITARAVHGRTSSGSRAKTASWTSRAIERACSASSRSGSSGSPG